MNYMKIDECSISNGLGIRTVLWVTGCSHHCFNCQNPETWDSNNGTTFDESAFNYLCQCLKQDYVSGVTFSGGDPLYVANRDHIKTLSKQLHDLFPNKNQWLYTGYTWDEIIHNVDLYSVLTYIDFVVDGNYVDIKRNTALAFRGSSNQRIIDVKLTLANSNHSCVEFPVLFTTQHRKDGVI